MIIGKSAGIDTRNLNSKAAAITLSNSKFRWNLSTSEQGHQDTIKILPRNFFIF